jgi:hypothetical protein
MAIVLDQQTAKETFAPSAGTSVFSFATLPAVGAAIIVTFWGYNAGGYAATSVTDNQGNSYDLHSGLLESGGTNRPQYACAIATTSSGTFTITINHSAGSDNYVIARATSFTGLLNNTVDASDDTNGGPLSPAVATTTGATTQADELVIAVMTLTGSSGDLHISTPATGYTEIAAEQSGFAVAAGEAGYKIISSIGTQSATWTHDDGGGGWSAIIGTYKASAVAGGPPVPWQRRGAMGALITQ